MNKAGKNASYAFEQASHSNNAKENVMPRYRIGKIDPNSTMEEWQREDASGGPPLYVTVGVVMVMLIAIYYLAS